jgi:hypothetical protein
MFFIGFLRSAGGTIEQRAGLEKRSARHWSSAFRRNSIAAQRELKENREECR